MRIDDDEFLFEMRTRLFSTYEIVHNQQEQQQKNHGGEEESTTPFVWKMMESELKTLDPNLQIIFLIIFSIIVVVSFFGNLLTIIVLVMR